MLINRDPNDVVFATDAHATGSPRIRREIDDIRINAIFCKLE
jgi:hypothetical protein